MVRRLFEPLGWNVDVETIALDPEYPGWGESHYVYLELNGTICLSTALFQIHALLPVLTDSKHYWVGDDEIAKLLRAGVGWLAGHPGKELIMTRYLAHHRDMVEAAASLMVEGEGGSAEGKTAGDGPAEVNLTSTVVPLHTLRGDAVMTELKDLGARRVVDIGCGEGTPMQRLMAEPHFTRFIGTDVAAWAMGWGETRLRMDEVGDRHRERVRLIQSSARYADDRIAGLDAAVLIEAIEHIGSERLSAVVAKVFVHARPRESW